MSVPTTGSTCSIHARTEEWNVRGVRGRVERHVCTRRIVTYSMCPQMFLMLHVTRVPVHVPEVEV